jgi:cbb3-type cytochrome oxidase subunit 1
MGIKMIKIAAFYFMVGVLMGMGMSMTNDHSLTPVHVHLNLLGWVSLAIGGLIYHIFPEAETSKLGKTHFWTTNVGVPLMMSGLAIYALFQLETIALLLIPTGGILIVIGTITFFINILKNVSGSEGQVP